MSNLLARIGIGGDSHLNSKSYGAHRDYPKESLEYFCEITKTIEELGLTHFIGAGDFTFSRFHSLEFREAVEAQLNKQMELLNGNRYEVFGNHDEAGYGMTERDYYIKKGLIKPSTNFTVGNLHVSMIDYGKLNESEMNIGTEVNAVNIAVAHDFYKFKTTKTADFGKAIILDDLEKLYGLDYLVCGHVHKIMGFDGTITKDNIPHNLHVEYPGCPTRPAYREGYMDNVGHIVVFSLYDDGKVTFEIKEFELWPIDKSFNLELKKEEAEKKLEKENRVDISDIVKQLDLHDRNVGNPEDIIESLKDVPDNYKNKALNLLKSALE